MSARHGSEEKENGLCVVSKTGRLILYGHRVGFYFAVVGKKGGVKSHYSNCKDYHQSVE